MDLNWKKLGRVFNPITDGNSLWMSEYAQIPFPFLVDENTLRIYFATRPEPGTDKSYVSRSSYIEVEASNVTKVTKIAECPIFDLGGAGTFDEFGSMTSSIVKVDNLVYAYYTGWSRLHTVPYTMANGMAVSSDGGVTFKRYSDGPIMGPTADEPFLLSGPVVKIIDDKWNMWYLNGYKWIDHNDKFEPVYRLCHATSTDGFNWVRTGKFIIPSIYEDECQVGFALFRKRDLWHVIFAYRKAVDFREGLDGAYQLGYASSKDLTQWSRDDSKVGIERSDSGWDSQMLAYPQVIEIKNEVYLFYCGNNFGKEGFGVAVLDI